MLTSVSQILFLVFLFDWGSQDCFFTLDELHFIFILIMKLLRQEEDLWAPEKKSIIVQVGVAASP